MGIDVLTLALARKGGSPDFIGEPIVDITDRISGSSFDFSTVESGLYWTDGIGINIGGAYVSGLFVVLKMTDTIANVWAVHTGTIFICNKGTISTVSRSLMTPQDYYSLTTTSKQILGAINELDAQLDSHSATITEIQRSSISAPATAQVGQIIVVKEVDENGKPIAWEAVDFPAPVTDEHINELINQALGNNN